MNTPAYPYYGDPNYWPDNLNNPYGLQYGDASRGLTYYNAPESNSTMMSDSVIMTKRLKQFVPSASVKVGAQPVKNLMTPNMLEQEDDKGGNYKSMFQ